MITGVDVYGASACLFEIQPEDVIAHRIGAGSLNDLGIADRNISIFVSVLREDTDLELHVVALVFCNAVIDGGVDIVEIQLCDRYGGIDGDGDFALIGISPIGQINIAAALPISAYTTVFIDPCHIYIGTVPFQRGGATVMIAQRQFL